jgi:hypothetical protein
MTDLTKINTPFGQLDRKTKGALLLAAHEGAEIEFFNDGCGIWTNVGAPVWVTEFVYRVKPISLTPDIRDEVIRRLIEALNWVDTVPWAHPDTRRHVVSDTLKFARENLK